MSRWSWILKRVVRQIWFRAALISLASLLLAVLAALVSRYIPYQFTGDVGQDAVGTILQIMASSMLAVTTFSLTAMVSAYSSATQLATPRATQLMISDPTSQNALSTFLGAFVFSIVGIIGLQTSIYGQEGRIILFGATVLIVLWVIVTLLRWIAHITAFGRMSDVIDRVEKAAASAMRDFAHQPTLGGSAAVTIPAGTTPVTASEAGYVTHIDVPALGRLADKSGCTIHVTVRPGTMVHPHRELARVEGELDDDAREDVADAFTLDRHRSFDGDPRLGLIALSEIASRALSPAVNDPGTAIEVLNAILRVMLNLPADPPDPEPGSGCARVHVPRPSIEEMLVDAFRPIVRDGGGMVEVTIRLSATLAALEAALPKAHVAISAMADHLAETAAREIADPQDRADFARAHEENW